MSRAAILVPLACAAVWAVSLSAQVQFRTETTVVHLDVVVRDASGRPIDDLVADDFEVFEDGVAQPLVWFDRSAAGTAAAHAAGARPAFPRAADLPDGPPQSIVAFVFHQLPAQPRLYATRAAEALVAKLAPGDYAAVYVFDQELREVASFTRDRDVLKRAIRSAALTPPAYQETSPLSSSAESEGPNSASSDRGSAQTIANLRQRVHSGFGQLSKQFEADAQGDAFGRLVALLDGYVGRRSVVLFSEGLAMPEAIPRLEDVIDAAGPAHVSFYTIDANGLRTSGRSNEVPQRPSAGELTSSSATNRERARLSPLDKTLGMRPLADLTGGIYVSDTNDLNAALARVDADRRSYYVLAYRSPSGGPARGRAIDVRVKRPGTHVRARTTRSQFTLGVGSPRESQMSQPR